MIAEVFTIHFFDFHKIAAEKWNPSPLTSLLQKQLINLLHRKIGPLSPANGAAREHQSMSAVDDAIHHDVSCNIPCDGMCLGTPLDMPQGGVEELVDEDSELLIQAVLFHEAGIEHQPSPVRRSCLDFLGADMLGEQRQRAEKRRNIPQVEEQQVQIEIMPLLSGL